MQVLEGKKHKQALQKQAVYFWTLGLSYNLCPL